MAVKPLTSMPAASALSGSELFYAQQGGADVQVLASALTSSVPAASQWFDGHAYGIVANGSADDTTALQNAINAAQAVNGTLFLPAGTLKITSTIVITNKITIRGAGSSQSGAVVTTNLFWQGASTTTPLLDLQGIRDSVFSDFYIQANSGHPLGIGIKSTTITGFVSTSDFFENIVMDGVTTAIDKGFVFATGSGGNSGNDVNTFLNCQVVNYATAGWSFEHTQSKAHRLIKCAFQGSGSGSTQYGVTTHYGGGSFSWIGGNGGGNATADFYLGGSDDVILIQDGNFENSGRFLLTDNGSSTWGVTLIENRFSANSLNADKKAIIYGFVGPLNLIGNVIGEDNSQALTISMPSGNSPIGVAIGNVFGTSLATPFINGAWISLNNQLNSPSTGIVPNTTTGGMPAVTIANLPTCNLISVGQQATVSNGQTTPAWNGTVSTTGAVYAPVTCVQTGAASFGWVYR